MTPNKSTGHIILAALRDGSNTLRSFFGTNILTMSWAFSVLGAMLGPIATMVAALIVYRATLTLIRVKQSLPNHKAVVTYGGVVSAVAGKKGQTVVDMLVAFTQFATCISYIAFSGRNLMSIADLSDYYCVLTLTTIIVIVSFFHTPKMLAVVSVITNMMMFSGIAVILTTISFEKADDVRYFIPEGLPIGLATLSSSLGGITTVLDVERTMAHKPGRYIRFLTVVLPCVVLLLSTVGVVGYLTFGKHTCAVISLSIHKESWQHWATQTLLTLGPCLEGVLNSFPLFVITERYCLVGCLATWAESHPQLYFYAHRVFWFIPIGLIAYGVPFIGYITSITGAVGYASLSFIVPIVCEYLRSKKTSFSKEEIENSQSYHTTDVISARSNRRAMEESEHDDARYGSFLSGKSSGRESNGVSDEQRSDATIGIDQSVFHDVAQGNTEGQQGKEHSVGMLEDGGTSKSGPNAPGDAQFLPYRLSAIRKVELGLVLAFGICVVVAGATFSVKEIVAQLNHTADKEVC